MAKVIRFTRVWSNRRDHQPKPAPASALRLLSVFLPTFFCLLIGSALLLLSAWSQPFWGLVSLPALVYLIYRRRNLWQLLRHTWRFRHVGNPSIQLFYDPTIYAHWNPSTLIEDCEHHLRNLSNQFGIKHRRKLVVFYFGTWEDISNIFGSHYGGAALRELGAILVAGDNNLQESIRHELTHLFTATWNEHAPPLLTEGIATWLQGTDAGQPLDFVVQGLLQHSPPSLKSLLQRKFFFSNAYRYGCYKMAGSFSGYLIRSYGWEKYKKLFRHAYRVDFERSFKKCIGISFETAEELWRKDIVSGNSSKAPGAKR